MVKKIILLICLLFICAPAYAGLQSEPINQPFKYSFSSGAVVTTVKSGPGILHTLTVTGGTTGTIQIYDGSLSSPASLAQIASFTTTNALTTYIFDVEFASACTIVAGGVLKYTVSYL